MPRLTKPTPAKSKVVKTEQITGKFNPPFGVLSKATGFLTTPPFGPNPNAELAKTKVK